MTSSLHQLLLVFAAYLIAAGSFHRPDGTPVSPRAKLIEGVLAAVFSFAGLRLLPLRA